MTLRCEACAEGRHHEHTEHSHLKGAEIVARGETLPTAFTCRCTCVLTARAFHAVNGWYFKRLEDGRVRVVKRAFPREDASVEAMIEFDADTWASIVASVTAEGENAGTFQAAEGLHAGKRVAVD